MKNFTLTVKFDDEKFAKSFKHAANFVTEVVEDAANFVTDAVEDAVYEAKSLANEAVAIVRIYEPVVKAKAIETAVKLQAKLNK